MKSRMLNVGLMVLCAAGLFLPAVVQADTLAVAADAYVTPRSSGNLNACNAGGQAIMPIGGEDYWSVADYTNGLMRWDLSNVTTASTDVTLTIHHGNTSERDNPRNFEGYSLDLYLMPSNNADWVEGTGEMTQVTGVAWNRKKGDYSTTPPDADKWLPTGTNSHQAGATLVGSIDWTSSMGKTLEYTIPVATFNAAVADGAISFTMRSLDVEAALQGGDRTQRLWYIATKEGDSSLVSTLSGDFNIIPEPNSIILMSVGILSMLAYAWRKRK